jgi:hypothetical protein
MTPGTRRTLTPADVDAGRLFTYYLSMTDIGARAPGREGERGSAVLLILSPFGRVPGDEHA